MEIEARHIQASAAGLATEDADSRLIADTAVAVWRDVSAALAPIIGQGGVDGLYQRSLHLRRGDYPWLAAAHEGDVPTGEFGALHAALSQQTSSIAVAANAALLLTFHDLLANLIGASLVERLLGPLSNKRSSAASVQDTTLP